MDGLIPAKAPAKDLDKIAKLVAYSSSANEILNRIGYYVYERFMEYVSGAPLPWDDNDLRHFASVINTCVAENVPVGAQYITQVDRVNNPRGLMTYSGGEFHPELVAYVTLITPDNIFSVRVSYMHGVQIYKRDA